MMEFAIVLLSQSSISPISVSSAGSWVFVFLGLCNHRVRLRPATAYPLRATVVIFKTEKPYITNGTMIRNRRAEQLSTQGWATLNLEKIVQKLVSFGAY